MSKRVLVICLVSVGVVLGAYFYAKEVMFDSPKNCNICHFMTPFVEKWAASTHKGVDCLKCHVYTPLSAAFGQLRLWTGVYNPRPKTIVPDRNCLRSGCHDRRLIESKAILTKRGINFDHMPHFTEIKRGIKLHCRSCHSDIVQGEHMKVSMNVCFLCHFKGASPDHAVTGCPSCHTAPKQPVVVKGQTISHEETVKAGLKCNRCHTEITRGDGIAPKEKCYFCHVEKTEMYEDVRSVHLTHVTRSQLDCLWCHPRIEHGKIRMTGKSQ